MICIALAAKYIYPADIRSQYSVSLPNRLNVSIDLFYALLINQVRVKKRHHFLVGTVKLQNTPAGEAASVRGKLWGYAEKGHKLHLKVKTNLFKKNYSVLYL